MTKKFISGFIFGIFVSLLITSVFVSQNDRSSESDSPTATIAPTSGVPSPTDMFKDVSRFPESEQSIINAIIDHHLEQNPSIPRQRVSVITIQAETFSSSALGCPQPGMSYAQVITPGYKVLLEVGGRTFTYHTSNDAAQIILCRS